MPAHSVGRAVTAFAGGGLVAVDGMVVAEAVLEELAGGVGVGRGGGSRILVVV